MNIFPLFKLSYKLRIGLLQNQLGLICKKKKERKKKLMRIGLIFNTKAAEMNNLFSI